ncbi:MAG: DUF1476 domain-containing protein [Rhodobacteraceae bacterium]|nr:DUF1476 domain-containing protein [Paracoccaceae bacterium]
MTTFDERENAFENKFARDAELEFLAEAARNKQVAYWAAELMGKSAMEAAQYAKELIRIDFETPGHEPLIRRVISDLDGIADEATVRAKMAEFLASARERVIGPAK